MNKQQYYVGPAMVYINKQTGEVIIQERPERKAKLPEYKRKFLAELDKFLNGEPNGKTQ